MSMPDVLIVAWLSYDSIAFSAAPLFRSRGTSLQAVVAACSAASSGVVTIRVPKQRLPAYVTEYNMIASSISTLYQSNAHVMLFLRFSTRPHVHVSATSDRSSGLPVCSTHAKPPPPDGGALFRL